MSRCKACNNALKESEIIWRKDLEIFEDLCVNCRHHAYNVPIEDMETLDSLGEEAPIDPDLE